MNQKTSLEELNTFFTKHPARFFLLAALLWVALMCFLNYKDGANFQWHDILVEANGMAFDLLVFGILLSMYEALREKREKVERLHEEIDDYRGWDEKEAMYRIVGAIKRLNKAGVSRMNLSRCFLSGATLSGATLSGATLSRANLSRANLSGANLLGANLLGANLSRAILSEADLAGADLFGADLSGADLAGADLAGTNLVRTYLSGAALFGAELSEVLVGDNWFEKLDNWQVIGREEIKQKYHINEQGRLIRNDTR